MPRALNIVVALLRRAQYLGQNSSRFAQQPPRGWLRAAQHAIQRATFFAAGEKRCASFFLPESISFFKHLLKKKKNGSYKHVTAM